MVTSGTAPKAAAEVAKEEAEAFPLSPPVPFTVSIREP